MILILNERVILVSFWQCQTGRVCHIVCCRRATTYAASMQHAQQSCHEKS